MGSAVSSGVDNNDLVDNLVNANYIRTLSVEKSFRAVDRALYILPQNAAVAYRDTAWKSGNLHLSAPCIYSEVLENLQLGPGMSFLNIGSGTGYLSTMAGLLLGRRGINHGIELHKDVIEYAYEKLEEFKKTNPVMDVTDFCEPIFAEGNALNIANPQLYDRVYCGAACPVSEIKFLHKLLKVGGILVVPCRDDLLKIERKTDTLWEGQSILPVAFATLRVPTGQEKKIKSFLPQFKPISLQEMARFTIRNCIRENKLVEMPQFVEAAKGVQKSNRRGASVFKNNVTNNDTNNNNNNRGVFVMHALPEVNQNRPRRRGSSIVFMHRVFDNYVSRRNLMRNQMEQGEQVDGNTNDGSAANTSNSEPEVNGRTDQAENSDRMEVDGDEETAATEATAPTAQMNEVENGETGSDNGPSDGVRGERRYQFHRIQGRIYAPHSSESLGAAASETPRHTPTIVSYSLASMGPIEPINYSMVGMRAYGLGPIRSRYAGASTEATHENPEPSCSNIRKKSDSEADTTEDQESVKRLKVDDSTQEQLLADAPVERVEADSMMESNEKTEVVSHESRMSLLQRLQRLHEQSSTIVAMADSNTDDDSTESTPPNDATTDQPDTIEEPSTTCTECGENPASIEVSMEESEGSSNEASTSGGSSTTSGEAGNRPAVSNRGIAILTINTTSDSSDGETTSIEDAISSQNVSRVLRSLRMRMLDEIDVNRRMARRVNNEGELVIERGYVPLLRDGSASQSGGNSSEMSTNAELHRINEENEDEQDDNINRRRPASMFRNPNDPIEIYADQVYALRSAIRDGINELPLPDKMKEFLDFRRASVMNWEKHRFF